MTSLTRTQIAPMAHTSNGQVSLALGNAREMLFQSGVGGGDRPLAAYLPPSRPTQRSVIVETAMCPTLETLIDQSAMPVQDRPQPSARGL